MMLFEYRDSAEVTCSGRLFQKLASETGKARLQTVERLNSSTASCDCCSDLQADRNVVTELNSTNLLNVSVSGLPHVVVFHDALQRLPRQLHQQRKLLLENLTPTSDQLVFLKHNRHPKCAMNAKCTHCNLMKSSLYKVSISGEALYSGWTSYSYG